MNRTALHELVVEFLEDRERFAAAHPEAFALSFVNNGWAQSERSSQPSV
jgi:hypothetical protein